MYFEERENDYVYRPENRGQDILCPKTSCLWNNAGVCSSVVNPTWIIPKDNILNVWNESECCFDNIDTFTCALCQYMYDYKE